MPSVRGEGQQQGSRTAESSGGRAAQGQGGQAGASSREGVQQVARLRAEVRSLAGGQEQVPMEGQGQPERRDLLDRQGQRQGQEVGTPEGQLALVPAQGEQALVLPQGSPVTLAPERPPGSSGESRPQDGVNVPVRASPSVGGREWYGNPFWSQERQQEARAAGMGGSGNREQALVPGQGQQDFWSRPPPSVQSPDQGQQDQVEALRIKVMQEAEQKFRSISYKTGVDGHPSHPAPPRQVPSPPAWSGLPSVGDPDPGQGLPNSSVPPRRSVAGREESLRVLELPALAGDV